MLQCHGIACIFLLSSGWTAVVCGNVYTVILNLDLTNFHQIKDEFIIFKLAKKILSSLGVLAFEVILCACIKNVPT